MCIAISLIISLYVANYSTFETRIIIGSAILGTFLLISLPIIFEWWRQNNVADAKKQQDIEKARQETLKEFRKTIATAKEHRVLLINAMGGEDRVQNIPLINVNNNSRKCPCFDLQDVTARIMRNSFTVKCGNEEEKFDYFAIKFRDRNMPNTIKTCTIIQTSLWTNDFSEEPCYEILGDGRELFWEAATATYRDRNLEGEFLMTDPNKNKDRATLFELSRLRVGFHPTLELVQ